MPNQTYLPLKKAAQKHNLDEKILTQLISAGMIEAKERNGEIVVAVDKNGNGDNEPQTKDEIIAAKFAHLKGQGISASEASRRYSEKHRVSISHVQFSRWAKLGFITVLEKGYRIQLDEAEVAYCAKVFAQKYHEYGGQLRGVSIFDEAGNPYQVKYPDIAEDRRNLRRFG